VPNATSPEPNKKHSKKDASKKAKATRIAVSIVFLLKLCYRNSARPNYGKLLLQFVFASVANCLSLMHSGIGTSSTVSR
jgi:hypothetical protein